FLLHGQNEIRQKRSSHFLSNRFKVPLTSSRVVKNDAERMTMAPADAANAVPEIYPIRAPSALHGTMMNCEHDAVTLTKRHNHRSRLHPRPLLCHYEFAADKILIGFGQQDRQLKREYVRAIEVLV